MLGVSGHRRTAPIALLCAAPFMVVLDANLIAIALPSIRDDLGFSRSGLQWVIGAYSLAFGGALLVAGRAGDLHGRRPLLVLGLALFSLASLTAAAAPSQALLLGARAIQGLGAAMAFPASLALIAALFEEGGPRNRALGVYGAVVSAAFVSGTALGGALTTYLGWRSVLVVNVPVGACAALAAHRLIPETRSADAAGRIDFLGALSASGAFLALLYALGLAADAGGPTAGSMGLIAVAALLAGLAYGIESSSPEPLLPRYGLDDRSLAGAAAAALLTVGTGVGSLFVLTLYLQEVRGYEPVTSGIALSLLGVAGVSAGLAMPRLTEALGAVHALAGALAVQAAGVAVLVPIGVDEGLHLVIVGTAILGFGHFGATVAFTALATARVSDDQQGVAMGVVSSAQQLGGAIGLALLVAVAGARTAAVGGAHPAAAGDPEAVVEGFRWALAVASGMSALAAGLVIAITRTRPGGPVRRPRHGWRTRRSRGRSSLP